MLWPGNTKFLRFKLYVILRFLDLYIVVEVSVRLYCLYIQSQGITYDEYVGNIFPQNIGRNLPIDTTSHPRAL